VPPRLPRASGADLVGLLQRLGYEVVRQRGSHVQVRRNYPSGTHRVTVPAHRQLAKGTLGDIIARVSIWSGIPREDLLSRL
jgi:predicted RNA binding protein YcfA (HicA-like mRNA interferase family)